MVIARRAALVFGLIAMVAAVGGFVLGTLDAPAVTYYALVLALASASVLRVLAPGIGVRGFRPRGTSHLAAARGPSGETDVRLAESVDEVRHTGHERRAARSGLDEVADILERMAKMDRAEMAGAVHELTARERAILSSLAAGRSSREIAAEFGISQTRARAELWRITRKLRRTEAARTP